jgi:hypothetical protein
MPPIAGEIFTISRQGDYHILGYVGSGDTNLRNIATLVFYGTLLAAGTAHAGPRDGDALGPPAMLNGPARGFSGFYGALSFGGADGTLTVSPLASEFGPGQGLGLVGGYNWQRGALVYGGEVRILQLHGTDWNAGGGTDAYDTLTDLRGRVGYGPGEVLIYGALGASWGVATPAATDTDGLTFGIGVEMNLTDRLFLGADLSRRDLDGSGVAARIDTLTLSGGFRF